MLSAWLAELSSIVLSEIVSAPSFWMPPPSPLVPTELSSIVLSVIVSGAKLSIPPPKTLAELPERVLPVIVRGPVLSMPPPAPAELPERVQSVTISVPVLSIPPPRVPDTASPLSSMVELVTVMVPVLAMPPPRSLSMVQLVTVSVPALYDADVAVRDGQAGEGGRHAVVDREHAAIAPTPPLPLTVTMLAPGPSISSGPDGGFNSSVLDSLIVCGVAALKTVGSNSISLPARFVLALAWVTQ